MKTLRSESGSILVIVALSLPVVLGFVGLALDVGNLLHDKRILQSVADAAAVAGAAEVPNSDYATVALGAASLNGLAASTNCGTGTTVVCINNPPHNGPYTGSTDTSYVEAIVSQQEPTMFMGLFGRNSITVSARAVAVRGAPGSGCIYTLGSGGISASGTVNLSATNCPILDNGGISVSGNVVINAESIGYSTSVSKSGGVSLIPTPVKMSSKVSDPLAYLTPPIYSSSSCTSQPSGNTLGPSSSGGIVCYNGLSFSGNGSYTFNPGLYVINGNFSVSGSPTFTGTGVTFYFPSVGGFTGSGSASINFSAPTSGPYNGMLFWEAPGDPSGITLSGGSTSVYEGIVYAPGGSASMSGGGGITLYADFVVSSISISGNVNLNNYDALNATSPLAAVKMVE